MLFAFKHELPTPNQTLGYRLPVSTANALAQQRRRWLNLASTGFAQFPGYSLLQARRLDPATTLALKADHLISDFTDRLAFGFTHRDEI